MSSSKSQSRSVADLIKERIQTSGRSVSEIAAEAGWDKVNVLELILQGRTKLPVNKVRPLAEALDMSPASLLRVTLQEYMPDTYEAVREVLECEFLSDFERDALEAARHVSGEGQASICITRSDPLVIVSVPVWEKNKERGPSTPAS